MKKMVCVLLAVLVLAGGATAFAADGNSGKETVIPYYDIGVTVTMPPAYAGVPGGDREYLDRQLWHADG